MREQTGNQPPRNIEEFDGEIVTWISAFSKASVTLNEFRRQQLITTSRDLATQSPQERSTYEALLNEASVGVHEAVAPVIDPFIKASRLLTRTLPYAIAQDGRGDRNHYPAYVSPGRVVYFRGSQSEIEPAYIHIPFEGHRPPPTIYFGRENVAGPYSIEIRMPVLSRDRLSDSQISFGLAMRGLSVEAVGLLADGIYTMERLVTDHKGEMVAAVKNGTSA